MHNDADRLAALHRLLLADHLGIKIECRCLTRGVQVDRVILCEACGADEANRERREQGHEAACFDPEANAAMYFCCEVQLPEKQLASLASCGRSSASTTA